jgi:hypothetical protein
MATLNAPTEAETAPPMSQERLQIETKSFDFEVFQLAAAL